MKQPALYTARAVALFLALCRRHTPRDIIAAELGWSIRQVTHLHEHLQRHGRQPYGLAPRACRKLSRPSPLRGYEEELRRLSQQDLSAVKIAERFGVTPDTAKGFMTYHGLYAMHRRRHGGGRRLSVGLAWRAPSPAQCIDDLKAGEWLAQAMEGSR